MIIIKSGEKELKILRMSLFASFIRNCYLSSENIYIWKKRRSIKGSLENSNVQIHSFNIVRITELYNSLWLNDSVQFFREIQCPFKNTRMFYIYLLFRFFSSSLVLSLLYRCCCCCKNRLIYFTYAINVKMKWLGTNKYPYIHFGSSQMYNNKCFH